MHEIIFRGKRKDNGEWVEGYFNRYSIGNRYFIAQNGEYDEDRPYMDFSVEADFFEIIPETVGQFTGLTDKNGKKIFEGDVIANSCGRKETVEFYKGRYYPFIAFPEYNCWDEKECEVIGTIHDNPELIGGEPE